jgi:hypothetical protein
MKFNKKVHELYDSVCSSLLSAADFYALRKRAELKTSSPFTPDLILTCLQQSNQND